MSGTMSGPGAIARPDRRADQPQASCSQSTMERSIAPNAAEKKIATNDAPVKWRDRNKEGCTSGARLIMQWSDEKADEDCSKKKGPKDARRPPAPAAALHQPEGDARHAGRDEHHAERSGPLDRLARDVRQSAPPDDQGGYPDRHVDQEDPAASPPRPVVHR